MKKIFTLITTLSLSLICSYANADSQNSEKEIFEDWELIVMHDEMSPTSRIEIRTKFTPIPKQDFAYQYYKDKEYYVGFEIFGGSLITLSYTLNLGGKHFWPYCEYNNSSFSVDGAKAQYIATIEEPGDCNSISTNGSVIKAFKAGSQAKLRLGYNDGFISLKGFSEAWARARQLSR